VSEDVIGAGEGAVKQLMTKQVGGEWKMENGGWKMRKL
jgi:hypothetical protein